MREEGISQKRDINLFPLVPFPFSLNHKVKSPPKAEEINKKPPYDGCGKGFTENVVGRGGAILISDEIPPTAMQATMGHLERKSNAQRGTAGDEILLSQNFDKLRMTRRGKADFLFAPYARHRFLQKRKTICINKNTYRLILSLIAPALRRLLFCFNSS